MGAMPIRAEELMGAGTAFNEGDDDFEDLGVVEGDEENHDEGLRNIQSIQN
jgi:hypothetical protein